MNGEQGTPNSASDLQSPGDDRLFDLVVFVLLLILVAIEGGVKRGLQGKPVAATIQLAEPQHVPLSAHDTAAAAQLLGSGLAQLVRDGGKETP